mgnify:CR=1 FL=1
MVDADGGVVVTVPVTGPLPLLPGEYELVLEAPAGAATEDAGRASGADAEPSGSRVS